MADYLVKTLTATINGKEDPNTLYVNGTIIVNGEYSTVKKVIRVDPQGINTKILLLELIVEETGTAGEVELGFSYEEEVLGKQFDGVSIVNAVSGGSVDVDYQG